MSMDSYFQAMFLGPLVAALLSVGIGSAHAEVLAARIDPDNIAQVLVVRRGSNAPRLLKTFDGSVVDASPGPSGRLVGAIVAHRPNTKGAGRTFRLHILEENGDTYRTLDHVQRFVFSPDGEFIAVIRGNGYEGGPGFFPESTEIIGLRGPDLGPIAGLEKATDLQWSRFSDDGLVLLARVFEGRTTIVEYIVQTRTVVPTHYLSLHFSPDGEYYYLTPAESLRANICQAGLAHDSCVRVFERDGYRALALPLEPKLRRPLGWADGRRMLVANERNHDCQVFDVMASSAEQTYTAVDWRWSPRRGYIVRQSAKKANFRKIGKPQIRTLIQ